MSLFCFVRVGRASVVLLFRRWNGHFMHVVVFFFSLGFSFFLSACLYAPFNLSRGFQLYWAAVLRGFPCSAPGIFKGKMGAYTLGRFMFT